MLRSDGRGEVSFDQFVVLMTTSMRQIRENLEAMNARFERSQLRAVLLRIPIFSSASADLVNALVDKLEPTTVPAGTYLMRQGEDGEDMYIIMNGEVDILIGPDEMVVATSGNSTFFGEIALIKNSKRTAGVRTNMESRLCKLTKDAFDEIMARFPGTKEKILQVSEGRDRAKVTIEKVKLFQKCSKGFMGKLRSVGRTLSAFMAEVRSRRS